MVQLIILAKLKARQIDTAAGKIYTRLLCCTRSVSHLSAVGVCGASLSGNIQSGKFGFSLAVGRDIEHVHPAEVGRILD